MGEGEGIAVGFKEKVPGTSLLNEEDLGGQISQSQNLVDVQEDFYKRNFKIITR